MTITAEPTDKARVPGWPPFPLEDRPPLAPCPAWCVRDHDTAWREDGVSFHVGEPIAWYAEDSGRTGSNRQTEVVLLQTDDDGQPGDVLVYVQPGGADDELTPADARRLASAINRACDEAADSEAIA